MSDNKQKFWKKHKIRSKLEEEKVRKRLQAEEEEKLDVVGQESDKKAVKWVCETAKEQEKLEKDRQDKILDGLSKKTKGRLAGYKQGLVDEFYKMLSEIDWPQDWQYLPYFDGKGVRLVLKSPSGKVYQRAFKLSYDPKFDYAAIFKFSVWAEDLRDLESGDLYGQKTESGIYLPN